MDPILWFILGLVLVIAIIVVANIKIVPQSRAMVIERLGAYSATWQTGIHVKIPFIERIAKNVSLSIEAHKNLYFTTKTHCGTLNSSFHII